MRSIFSTHQLRLQKKSVMIVRLFKYFNLWHKPLWELSANFVEKYAFDTSYVGNIINHFF